ncbi:MAG: tetratricopeptide repeat protein, partial [Anaerolineaceae bacterium]
MYLSDRKPNFRPVKPRSNLYRVMILLVLIGMGYYIVQGVWVRQDIEPLFLPTPTPTRTANSYELEGDTQFTAGNLDAAIAAYQEATRLEPNNGELWSRLARIQTYSSNSMTTSKDQLARLTEAMDSINKAVEVAPDDSEVRAIQAFVLDWNAVTDLVGADQAEKYLTQAQQEAGYALQLDPANTLALAFYAEILVDQQKWQQAEQYIEQAVQRDDSLMDVHRIYAYVKETSADYEGAIEEYKKAAEIMPNLTFLYIKIGVTYRHLEQYDLALEYFAKAADINTQLGVKDPLPYISIAKTYSQMPSADFFAAALNIKKALYLDPTNPNTYGQLGIIYDHGRNFEGSV